jgi:hypothetical protein
MLPRKTAEQNGYLVALFSREGAFHRAVEVRGPVEASDFAQAGALGVEALFDFLIILDLHKIGRHHLPPA